MRGRRGMPAAVLIAALLVTVLGSSAQAARRAAPAITARAAAIYDPQAGAFLYALRADHPLQPASLAKMVVAILTAERLSPNDRVYISHAAAVAEADAVRWPEGKGFRVDDVLHGLLMESSNGAAVALAERMAGSLAAFKPLMNRRARELGATDSYFVTPNGLDARRQHSTAHDLALIAAAFLRVPWLASVAATRVYQLRWPDGRAFVFENRNRFLYRYPGAIGVKNGFTSEARNSVAAAAIRKGRILVTVVLSGGDVYNEAVRLMDWGFGVSGAAPPRAQRDVPALLALDQHLAVKATLAPATKAPRGSRAIWIAVATILLAYVTRVSLVRHRQLRRMRFRAFPARPSLRLAAPLEPWAPEPSVRVIPQQLVSSYEPPAGPIQLAPIEPAQQELRSA